jgi:hypothetical protein
MVKGPFSRRLTLPLGDGDSAARCPYQFLPSVQSADSVFIRVHPWFMTVKPSAKLTKPMKSHSLFNVRHLSVVAGSKSDFFVGSLYNFGFTRLRQRKEYEKLLIP